ncbi:hypothetical protein P7K49_001588 [Saguinus oedipus]|uniref:PDZ domain-containing protein n=1 Tax=Saguinus oedipus TaxID=9490 RepID=A0ABQ9WIT1_SAGOE|nr:hypothetical protein P7K49_001588 [Saguinus oedipus]
MGELRIPSPAPCPQESPCSPQWSLSLPCPLTAQPLAWLMAPSPASSVGLTRALLTNAVILSKEQTRAGPTELGLSLALPHELEHPAILRSLLSWNQTLENHCLLGSFLMSVDSQQEQSYHFCFQAVVIRENKRIKVNLVLGDGRSLGLTIRGGAEYGLGIYITGVDPGSEAEGSGLKGRPIECLVQEQCFSDGGDDLLPYRSITDDDIGFIGEAN